MKPLTFDDVHVAWPGQATLREAFEQAPGDLTIPRAVVAELLLHGWDIEHLTLATPTRSAS